MAIISLLLLASLLPHLTFTARANVGIVNGKEAKPHSRPYMVSVQVKEQHICGGFLISDRFVMTAAHCRNNSPVLTVVLGAHNLRNKKENSVRIKVDSYYQHPKYTNESFHNDILLLKGDSGGPLVCGDTAVGVTSFGDPKICNSPDLPEVYTKISAYLPWIKSITGNGSSAILADEMKFF
ncbi:granzyme B(G,H)-like protein [Labeo rohita]|uniref:trypsin n=1 Tax=Labeo rohita TaxID=84645 RepID=A0A498MGZ6_LABRO|nr:granzyme B(G,H)-like protein [Labeo rohita]